MFDALLFYRLTTRYTLLWYGGRAFATVAASLVLLFLLSQTTVLYGRLARSNTMLQRERDSKLMSFEAIAAAISHEVKQPLTAMLANGNSALELLERSPPDVQEARDALTDIIGDGHRISDVIDGIRALFRKLDQRRQPVDMNGIVLDVLQSLRGELRDHGVAALPRLTAELPLVDGNRNQLQQVIHNLVHNAVEAMDGTTDRNRVLRLSTGQSDRDAIVVAVEDAGPAISTRYWKASLTLSSRRRSTGWDWASPFAA